MAPSKSYARQSAVILVYGCLLKKLENININNLYLAFKPLYRSDYNIYYINKIFSRYLVRCEGGMFDFAGDGSVPQQG